MRFVIAALLLALAFQSGASTTPVPDTPQLALSRFIDSLNNLDWEDFRATFAEDVTLFNPDIPQAKSLRRIDGRANVEASFRLVFEAARNAASPPKIVPTNLEVQQVGAVAVATFEFERGPGSFGRRTIVFAERERTWKVIHIHASNVTN